MRKEIRPKVLHHTAEDHNNCVMNGPTKRSVEEKVLRLRKIDTTGLE